MISIFAGLGIGVLLGGGGAIIVNLLSQGNIAIGTGLNKTLTNKYRTEIQNERTKITFDQSDLENWNK